jgi:hypothetical protein
MGLHGTGRYEEAEQVASRGVDMAEKLDLAPEVQRVRDQNLGILCRSLYMLADHYSFSPTGDRPRRAAQVLKLARRAVELMPEDKMARESLGGVLYRTGDWKGCIESLMKTDAPTNGSFIGAMAHWQLGEKAKARELFEQADKWLVGYAERWKQHHAYPSPAILRGMRAEAASLLGIKEPDSKRTSEPTPKTGTESK